jgi:invasion protein IalB
MVAARFMKARAACRRDPGPRQPERSPFTSAGTPARRREKPSARICSVTVLPVPVAPAISPWRLAYAPPADGGLALGEPVPDVADIGEPYLGAEFGDWDLRCVRTEDGNDPCQLYQLLQDQNGNAVAEISVFPLPEGQQAQAGVTIITPLETLLTEQLTLRVDAGQAKRYPFTFCAPVGCVSRIGLVPEEVQGFRRGARATVRIVPAAAPDQEVILTVSLAGFTAGFQAVVDGVRTS